MKLEELIQELDVSYNGEVVSVKEALEAALKLGIMSAKRSNKSASIQLTLKISNKLGRVSIAPELINKDPKPEPMPVTFYLDRQNELQVEDPNQKTFDDIPDNVKPITGKGA